MTVSLSESQAPGKFADNTTTSNDPRIFPPRVFEVNELIFLHAKYVRYRTSSAVIANLRALSSVPDDPRDVSRWQLPPNIGQRTEEGSI